MNINLVYSLQVGDVVLFGTSSEKQPRIIRKRSNDNFFYFKKFPAYQGVGNNLAVYSAADIARLCVTTPLRIPFAQKRPV